MAFCSISGFAQKQTFDVVSYTQPTGWQKTENEGGVQLSVTDKKTNGYAIAIITKATVSNAPANENFNNDWQRLVKGSVKVNNEPTMTEPANENGWNVLSGSANYTDGAVKGVATLLNATGNGQTVSVLLMTNTQKYQDELLSFLSSLELTKTSSNTNSNETTGTTNSSVSSSIAGLWTYNLLETSGYANGYPQYTAGYFRREYKLNEDGTYLFLYKNWSVYSKPILFGYEAGTWSVKGNLLTITPKEGKNEEWSKAASGRTVGWGSRIKSNNSKLETVTYRFEIKYYSGSENYALILSFDKPTERENTEQKTFSYSRDLKTKSLIDLPPGTKINTVSKAESTQQTNSIQTANNNFSPLAGKIWEANSPERYGPAYGNLSGFNTGGFWIYQYKFNADGTYQFVYNGASGMANTPVNVLQYETGTYSVNGNQLTITPQKGANEEWSVGKIDNGMSDSHRRDVLEKRIKLLKKTERKLEQITYPFTVEYWEGNKANVLLLQHAQSTAREGSPGANNKSGYFETPAAKATKFLDYK